MPRENQLESVLVANPNRVDKDESDQHMIQRIQQQLDSVHEASHAAGSLGGAFL